MIDINEKKKCCGCSACMNVCPISCIRMEEDEEGFLYPVIDKNKCVNCGLCENVCPIINCKAERKKNSKAYAVYIRDDKLRKESTSGGAFTSLAKCILQQGGIVCGCALDESLNAVHIQVDNEQDLCKLRGSKYIQSKIGNCYKDVKAALDNDKTVLFSGTPCQIEGLKFFLGKDYDKLYLVDIICHGVPSPKIWNAYIQHQEKKFNSPIKKISFRNKDFGWDNYRIKIHFFNGRIYKKRNWDDVYLKAYFSNMISRPSCYECSFRKVYRESDITLADFWGVTNIIPEYNDNKGVSLVITHSDRGNELLKKTEHIVEIQDVSLEKAIKYNSSINENDKIPDNRARYFDEFYEKGYDAANHRFIHESYTKKILRKIIKLAGK